MHELKSLYSPLRNQVEPYLRELEKEKKNTKTKTISDFVSEVYGDKITSLSGGREHATKVFEKMGSRILDAGLAREQKYHHSKKGTLPSAEAVPMFSRQTMLYEVKKKIGLEHDNGTFTIKKEFHALTLDLEKFRQADEAEAGDYDLNIVAAAIKNAEKEIIGLGVNIDDLVVGRYGGDEFYLFVIGDSYNDKLEKIKNIIKVNITSAQGYFQKGRSSQNFSIKHNRVETIEAPSDLEKSKKERQKFLEFIDKNSILDEHQIGVEVKYEEENPLTAEELERKKIRNIYPKEIEEISDFNAKVIAKMEYLINDHPDLKIPYWYALGKDKKAIKLAEKNGITLADTQKNVRNVLDFYQEYFIDPLLNEIVLGRFDIQDRLNSKEFSRIFVYEAKLKEVNDHLSWTYADERIIKKLWEENFKTEFRKEIKDGTLVVGRIGGSIIMMQKEGKILSSETEKKLRKFKNSHLESKYDSKRGFINHEIGFAEINTHKKKPADVFQRIFNEPTRDWLKKTFKRILNNEEEYVRFLDLLGNYKDDLEHTLTFLSARYFTGNRWKNRAITASIILKELKGTKIDQKKVNILAKFAEIETKKIEEEKLD